MVNDHVQLDDISLLTTRLQNDTHSRKGNPACVRVKYAFAVRL